MKILLDNRQLLHGLFSFFAGSAIHPRLILDEPVAAVELERHAKRWHTW